MAAARPELVVSRGLYTRKRRNLREFDLADAEAPPIIENTFNLTPDPNFVFVNS